MITDLKINAERKQFYYEKGYWTEKTLGDVWADRVASHPERTYVSDDQGSSYTYGEIDDKAARLAAWLVEQGVGPRGRGHVPNAYGGRSSASSMWQPSRPARSCTLFRATSTTPTSSTA